MSLVNELIKGLLPEEEKKQTTAVYAGGFKPPTSGHFEVVQQALKENPEINEFIIFVGAKPRDGISQTESLLIWEIYNNYLPFKVKIEPTSIPPIKAVYDFAKNHPTREVLWVIGAREGNEEDFKDITSRTKSISKYPNLELRTIVTSGGVSGTAARNAAKVSLDKFAKFVPNQLSDEEIEEVFNLVSGKVQEIQTPAKEKDVDPKELKMGIEVEMEHTDDPAKAKVIALQHLAEDPKYYTKLASLGLEENYVLQDLENQYGIDLDLYDNGKHLTLSRISIPKDKRGQGIGSKVMNQITQYADKENKPIYLTPTKDFGASSVNRLEQFYKQFGFKKKDRSDFSTKETMVRMPLTEAIDSSKFNFSPYIASLTKHMLDNGMKLEPLPTVQMIHDDYENGEDLFGNTAYYNPGNNSVVLFTYGRHPKDILRSYAHELVHVHQNMEDRLTGLGGNTDVNQDDHLEQIEREAYETGNIMFRSWTDSITGNKLEESVKALITEKKKKDPFGLLAYAQELGRLREDDVKKSPFSKEIQYWIDEDIKDYGDMLEFKIDLTDTYQYSFNSNLGEFYDDVNGVKIVVKLKPTSRNIPEFKFYSLQDGKQLSFSRLKHYNPKVMNTIFKIFMDEILPKNKKILTQPLDYTRYRLFRAMLNNNLDGRIYKVDTKDNPLEQSILLIQKIKSDTPLREKEESWKVYLDMDGVLADFDQRFKDISGMEPKEFEDKYGTKAFWNLIDEENKIKFWVGIPDNARCYQHLVDAVKDYDYELLTSPSAKKQSYLGKILWVKKSYR